MCVVCAGRNCITADAYMVVVQGSLAAMWHAAIGNVAAGSLFAGLQYLGAVGLSAGVLVACGAGTAVCAALVAEAEVRIINL